MGKQTQAAPGRRPPKAVRDALCREVGFRCPVKDCGVPYLTFHHFDPPWREERHHNPGGMIALCSNHAAKADGDYYPDDYLRSLKTQPTPSTSVRGEFDHMRRDLAIFVGSNLYYDVETMVEIDGERCVYFDRDEAGYLLLNFRMPTAGGESRAWMEDNVWLVDPGARNIDCPPRGRFLRVEFDNGDFFRIEFRDIESEEHFAKSYPAHAGSVDMFSFPMSIAHISERVDGGAIEFGTEGTRLPGNNMISNSTIVGCSVGISLEGFGGLSADMRARLLDELEAFNRRQRK